MGTNETIDLNEVNLFEILSAPTESKSNSDNHDSAVDESDFAIDFQKPIHEAETEPAEDEEPYDAEAEAEKLVNLIDVGNTIILSPIAGWKLKKNRGGKEAFAKMKTAYQKKASGKKLNETELALLESFESFKTDLALLNGEIPFSPMQRETLLKMAIPMCEKQRIKTNETFAFWAVLAGMEAGKITKILSA